MPLRRKFDQHDSTLNQIDERDFVIRCSIKIGHTFMCIYIYIYMQTCVSEAVRRRVMGRRPHNRHEFANHFLAGDTALLRGSPIRRPDGISEPFLRTSSAYIQTRILHTMTFAPPRRAASISYRENDGDATTETIAWLIKGMEILHNVQKNEKRLPWTCRPIRHGQDFFHETWLARIVLSLIYSISEANFYCSVDFYRFYCLINSIIRYQLKVIII